MRGNWIKVVLFILGMFMLASIAQVMLDPGLGKPDESRRVKHPAGFSFIPPGGWGGSVFYGNPSSMRVSPEKSTGRQPVIGVSRYTAMPTATQPQTPFTFQGKPALKYTFAGNKAWTWRIDFVRDDVPYSISITYPTETNVESGALWPFIESFRVEQVIDLRLATPSGVLDSATGLSTQQTVGPLLEPSTGPVLR